MFVQNNTKCATAVSEQSYLLPLSANNETELKNLAIQLRHHLVDNANTSIADIAHNLYSKHSYFGHRRIVISSNTQEFAEKLLQLPMPDLEFKPYSQSIPLIVFAFA